jgi:hypothetical protein
MALAQTETPPGTRDRRPPDRADETRAAPDIALETALHFAIIELCSILVMLGALRPGLNIRLPLGTSTEGTPRQMRAASDLGAGGTSLIAM